MASSSRTNDGGSLEVEGATTGGDLEMEFVCPGCGSSKFSLFYGGVLTAAYVKCDGCALRYRIERGK